MCSKYFYNRYKFKINTTPGRHDSASELEPMNGCCGEPVELSEEESGEQAILELTWYSLPVNNYQYKC